jgi:hypothetical protein
MPMPTWFAIVMCLALAPYLVVPILIWRTQRFLANPTLRSILPEFLPPSIRKSFDEVRDALRADQFEHCFDAVSNDHSPPFRLYFRGFVHRGEQISALVTSLLDDEQNDAKTFLEFDSRFDDGSELNTHNCEFLGAPIHSPHETSRAFSLIKNPSQLFRVHLHYLEQLKLKRAPLPLAGQEFLALKSSLCDDLVHQEQMGGLALDASAEFYKPTWAGAFLIAWHGMWPLSWFKKIIYKQRAKLWLKRLSSAQVT